MDNECIDFIIKHKWSKVKACPLCNERSKFYYFNSIVKCAKCRKSFSVRKNTIFEGSRLSLLKWFKAIEFVVENEANSNSIKLSKHINITQKSAYYMLVKLKSTGVINYRVFKKLKKKIDKTKSAYIRSLILSKKPLNPGYPQEQYVSLLKSKQEYYNSLKYKAKQKRIALKKLKSPYEVALDRALNPWVD